MKSYSINNTNAGRGVTLTELVVVIAILSLLATIMVPMAFNRMEQARIVVAKEECRSIADAMQQCAAIHGYYVPIRVLDNQNNAINPLEDSDDLFNEYRLSAGPAYLIKPTLDLDAQIGNQLYIGESGTEKLIQEWNGPFLQPQRVYVDETWTPGSEEWFREDYPLDPWGNPYRFYCRLGYIGDNGVQEDTVSQWEDNFTGLLNDRTPGPNNIYDDLDRFAIVSFGPDGEEDLYDDNAGTEPHDDIIYEFGGEITIEQMKPFY